MTEDEVLTLARKDARAAVDIVRGSDPDKDGPIIWLTGNSHMPPLRAFGAAETVWSLSPDHDQYGELWDAYAEEWEAVCQRHNIYIGVPDYDNAIYGVDMTYWTYDEDGENGENLSDEWKRRTVDSPEPVV